MSLLYFCSPSLKRRRQEDQELKVILSYRSSLKPIWATWDPVQKKKKPKHKNKKQTNTKRPKTHHSFLCGSKITICTPKVSTANEKCQASCSDVSLCVCVRESECGFAQSPNLFVRTLTHGFISVPSSLLICLVNPFPSC